MVKLIQLDLTLRHCITGPISSFQSTEGTHGSCIYATLEPQGLTARERYGSENTFTGFQPNTDEDKDEIGRIDFVWLGPKQRVHVRNTNCMTSRGWHVHGYSVLPNVFDDGVFCSDHGCVVADVVLCLMCFHIRVSNLLYANGRALQLDCIHLHATASCRMEPSR